MFSGTEQLRSLDEQKDFIKGFKNRCYPTPEQEVLFKHTFGCCRFIYNQLLADLKKEYAAWIAAGSRKETKPKMGKFDLANRLPALKKEYPFLAVISSSAAAITAQQLAKAFSNFFKTKGKKKYPKFKNRYAGNTFSLDTDKFYFKDEDRTILRIAKSKDPLKIKFSRPLPNRAISLAISKEPSGEYFISFRCKYTPEKTNGAGIIGIDLGLKDFAVLSNGERISNPKFFENSQKNLKRKQKSAARKQKPKKVDGIYIPGSKNYEKAKRQVACVHRNVRNKRNHFLHTLSSRLVNENQVIGLETLMVKNMVKNHSLAKAISSASWSRFTEMIKYKSHASQHCNIARVNTYYPSTHICNDCNTKLDYKLKLSQREWTCPACGTIHDRDINAARNIRDEVLDGMSHRFPLDQKQPAGIQIVF